MLTKHEGGKKERLTKHGGAPPALCVAASMKRVLTENLNRKNIPKCAGDLGGDKTFNCKKGDIKITIHFYGIIFDMEKCIENLLGNEDVIFQNHGLNMFLQYNNEGVLKGIILFLTIFVIFY